MPTSPDSELAALAGMAEAPDGSTPLAAIVICTYLDDNGDECLGLATRGTATTTDIVGSLVWAQHQLLTEFM